MIAARSTQRSSVVSRGSFASVVFASFVLSVAIVSPVGTLRAQDSPTSEPSIESLLDRAKAAHRNGETQEAIALLQQAIDRMQKEGAGGLADALPAVPKGWKADEPNTVTGNWGAGGQSFQWTQVSRTYRHEEKGLVVRVQITDSPQMVDPQRQLASMFSNPQYLKMMNMDPNKEVKKFDKEGWTGWITFDKQGREAQGVALGKSLLVTMDVNRAEQQAFDLLWKKVGFDALSKLDR